LAKTPIPKIAKDPSDRQQLGMLLRNLIQNGLDQKGSTPEFWQVCEQYHRNEMVEGLPEDDDGLIPIHIPFSQPRQDILTAQVCSALTRPDPYMLVETLGDTNARDALQKCVHLFWKSAGFEAKLRRASAICTDTNLCWFRVAWDTNPNKYFGGLIFDVIHPKHIVITPNTVEGIPGARLVGHRFYRRLREITDMQASGKYFEEAHVIGGANPQSVDLTGEIANSGAQPGTASIDPMDQRVELWDITFRYGAKKDTSEDEYEPEKWYRATVAYDTMAILSIDEYPYSRPWYFDAAYILGTEDAYYSGVSVGRNLSFIQDTINKQHAMLYSGAGISAFPVIFGPELPEKDFKYSFGEYVPTDSPAQSFFSPSIRFDGKPIIDQLEIITAIGDQVARASPNTMGAQQDHDATATETSIIASGVSVGIEEYIGNFSASFGEMAAFTIELLKLHWSEWQGAYAGQMQITQDMFSLPGLWEPNGKTPGNTPAAKLAAVDRLVSLAQAFGPASGLDPYELTKMAIANLGVTGADNLQQPKEEMIAQQQQQAQAAANPGGAPGGPPTQGNASPSGMGPPPNLPPQAAGIGGGPMPNPGPPGPPIGNMPPPR